MTGKQQRLADTANIQTKRGKRLQGLCYRIGVRIGRFKICDIERGHSWYIIESHAHGMSKGHDNRQ